MMEKKSLEGSFSTDKSVKVKADFGKFTYAGVK